MKKLTTILSVENALSWSWGTAIYQLIKQLSMYDFIRTVGQRRMKLQKRCECNKYVELIIDPMPISNDIVNHFDVTLLQNVESLKLVRTNYKKVVCRSGGMIVDKENNGDRYNDELAKVGAVIATNNQLYDIAKSCNDNAFLIPNGCNLDYFKPADPSPAFARSFTIGFAGNIWGLGLHYKGYEFYVKALTHLIGQVKSRTLLHAHTQIPHEDMPTGFYHQIDCLILPSIGEGCSNVVMEALACGVPVLITKVGYHGEMLEDRKNCLFIERDAQNIEDRVLELLNNPSLRIDLAQNGREFAEKHHDIKEIAKQYNKIFQLVLKE